jgi:hypothetical protein
MKIERIPVKGPLPKGTLAGVRAEAAGKPYDRFGIVLSVENGRLFLITATGPTWWPWRMSYVALGMP